MIMAALDNALDDRAIQRDFADDAVAWADTRPVRLRLLSIEG